VHEWLSDAADRLAAASGIPREQLELSNDEIDRLLDLAGSAAHESGARLNAPLLTHLVGRAAAASGKSVAELADALDAHRA
jgi:hypothetical protein